MAYYGKGSSGQILTDLPAPDMSTFQAAASQFTPNSVVHLWDDFTSWNVSSSSSVFCSVMTWNYVVLPLGQAALDNGHPGIFIFPALAATAVNGIITVSRSTGDNSFILGGGQITLNWVIKLPTLSNSTNRYILQLGLGDTMSTSDQANGVYFEYSDNENSGDWIGKTASASSRTSANSAIAAESTSFHNFQIIINAAGSSASFYIDGTQIANSPLSATMPSTAISPFIKFIATAGTVAQGSILPDLFYMTQVLTTAR